MQKYAHVVTPFEMDEMKIYGQIYTIGQVRRDNTQKIADRSGFYKVKAGE